MITAGGTSFLLNKYAAHRQYVVEKLTELRAEVPFDGLWLDSWVGLAVPTDYSAAQPAPQLAEGIAFQRAFSEMGLSQIVIEGLGAIGRSDAYGDYESYTGGPQREPAIVADVERLREREYLLYSVGAGAYLADDTMPIYHRLLAAGGLIAAVIVIAAVTLLLTRLTRENYVAYATNLAQERVDRVAQRIGMQMMMESANADAPSGESGMPGSGPDRSGMAEMGQSPADAAGMMGGATPVQRLVETELEYGSMTRLDVIDSAGVIVGSGDPERIGQEAGLDVAAQAQAGGEAISRILETENGHLLRYAAPLDVEGSQYVVVVDEPLANMEAALQRNRNSLLVVLTVGVAVTFLILGVVVWNAGLDLEYHQQEEDRVKDLLGRYVSHQVARQILAEGGLKTGGERRQITVLFADIRGFTRFSETLPPEAVVTLLNEFLEAMTDVVFRYDGTLDKFLGDGLMVIFGAPAAPDDSADRALACAREMQTRFRQLRGAWRGDDGAAELGLGIGVNTGNAIVGSIGSARRLDYTAIGDVVNVAARLEGIALAGQILLSETAYAGLSDQKGAVPLGPQQLKGKRRPVPVYAVTETETESEPVTAVS